MRLLFYLILAIAVIYLIWRFRHQLAEGWRNLVSDFRAWLEKWFGSKEKAQTESEVLQPVESIARRRFAEFHDPFRQGLAARWPAAEVVRYTFDAIEAWGGEQSIDRTPDETPSEYLEQLGTRFPQMEVELSHLGELYGQVAYAADQVNPKEALSLQRLWQCLDPSVNSGTGQTRFR